jgi:hypothetical protein
LENEVLRFDVEVQNVERPNVEKIMKMSNSCPPDSPLLGIHAHRRGKVFTNGVRV